MTDSTGAEKTAGAGGARGNTTRRRRVKLKDKDFKGLHFRRIEYKPGLGVCSCEVCLKAAEAPEYRMPRTGAARTAGSPVAGCLYVNREGVFASKWQAEHERRSGCDLAQELMRRPPRPGEKRDHLWNRGPVAWILTRRERVILATVIQWLGSNVGFCFLCEALRVCGYDVVPRSKPDFSEEATGSVAAPAPAEHGDGTP